MSSINHRISRFWQLLLRLPISIRHQVVFAESLAEALTVGMAITKAIDLAARVNPSWRFRYALGRMRQDVSAGYGLEISLARSGARVMPQLLAALRVGEAHGKLAEELFALTRAVSSRAAHWLRQAVGRREEATRFAAALARLLCDEGVTVRVVAAAGSIAGGGNPRFEVAVRGIVAEMESGADLAAALKYQPRYFDRLYCGLLEAADSRARLRACLEHLGTEL